MKTLKKYVALLALASLVLGPMQALAATATTTLSNGGGTGNGPIVIAKWEMDGPWASYLGTDAIMTGSGNAGSQMLPSGQYQVNKTVAICGIVTDANGRDFVSNLYGDVYYPTTVSLGSSHVDPITGQNREVKTCGEMVRECTMTRLTDANAFNLFCTNIRNNNSSLPVFAANYNYANVCDDANAGVLAKKTAYAYCCDFTMSYEDPAGSYKVNVWGTNGAGANGSPLSNQMQYLTTKAFDVDFTAIDYGTVVPSVWKPVAGDTTWTATPGMNSATIRNVSSTPLQIGVWQNDMGIKDPDGTTYVTYGAAIGSGSAYTTYGPNLTMSTTDPTHKATPIIKYLKLSEKNELDFEVKVSKFPEQLAGPFIGTVELSATNIAQLPCPNTNPTNY
ncbi:MAG: hypothetical protein WA093_04355 [Minisyncoccales bacterium]